MTASGVSIQLDFSVYVEFSFSYNEVISKWINPQYIKHLL